MTFLFNHNNLNHEELPFLNLNGIIIRRLHSIMVIHIHGKDELVVQFRVQAPFYVYILKPPWEVFLFSKPLFFKTKSH